MQYVSPTINTFLPDYITSSLSKYKILFVFSTTTFSKAVQSSFLFSDVWFSLLVQVYLETKRYHRKPNWHKRHFSLNTK